MYSFIYMECIERDDDIHVYHVNTYTHTQNNAVIYIIAYTKCILHICIAYTICIMHKQDEAVQLEMTRAD